MLQELPMSMRIRDTLNFPIVTMIMKGKSHLDTSKFLWVPESQHRTTWKLLWHASFLVVNNLNLRDLSLYCSFGREFFPRCSSYNGNNVWVFAFTDLLPLCSCPSRGGIWWRFTPMRLFSVSLASFQVFNQPVSLCHLFGIILQLDAFIGVVVVAFTETIIFIYPSGMSLSWDMGVGFLPSKIMCSHNLDRCSHESPSTGCICHTSLACFS